MKELTIFTPTFNRAHTLPRLYSSLLRQTSDNFEWLIIDDGSTDGTKELAMKWIEDGIIPIEYVHKQNEGLYSGYNEAYSRIGTELNMCIDSDDTVPPDAVERILKIWKEKGSDRFAGIIGLDYDMKSGSPIGGAFPTGMEECYFLDLSVRNIHKGDTKQVMRTDLMKEVAPQKGFPGEKNFNPVFMLLKVCDTRPLIVANECFCNVEYQDLDSMSRMIYRQYLDSPRSFASLHRLEMTLNRSTLKNRFRCATHYVAECMIARDGGWLENSPRKAMTLAATLPGFLLYLHIKRKNKGKA